MPCLSLIATATQSKDNLTDDSVSFLYDFIQVLSDFIQMVSVSQVDNFVTVLPKALASKRFFLSTKI